jgi:excisionase family DNA binding protein
MPRFRELERLATGNDQLWHNYREVCKGVAFHLYRALEDYLEFDEGQLVFVPSIGEYDPSAEYALEDALRMGKDSYFHVGLQLVLETQALVIPVGIKSFPEALFNEHEIRIETHDKAFRIIGLSRDQLDPICEYIFRAIKADFQESLDRWVEHGQLPGQVPFIFYHPYPPEDAARFTDDRPEAAPIHFGSSQPVRQWMTTEEAADYSGYDVEHVRRLIRQGKVDAVKKGRNWWISANSFTNYVEAMQSSEDRRAGPKGTR